jgi:hypothetical protein
MKSCQALSGVKMDRSVDGQELGLGSPVGSLEFDPACALLERAHHPDVPTARNHQLVFSSP